MNCPACGYYNPPAQQQCFHCSLSLPIPAGEAVCAAHPEVKATGACSRCGTFGCGACLTARGTDWLCASCLAIASRIPWDDRESIGMWRAWWRTSVLMISSPNQTLSTAEPNGSIGSSMLFALLSTTVGFVPTILLVLPTVTMTRLMAPSVDYRWALALGLSLLVTLFYLCGAFAFQLVALLGSCVFDHLGLMVLGGNPKSLTVTLRAHALSMGTYLVGLFPLCSFMVVPLWALAVRIIAVTHLHKTTGGKATLAVLLPIVALCGGTLTFYAAVFGLAMQGAH